MTVNLASLDIFKTIASLEVIKCADTDWLLYATSIHCY